MNFLNVINIYGLIGKLLCGCAGAIVGGVLLGSLVAIPGALIGLTIGHLLEKAMCKTSLSK
jgi:hypothetical protein